MEIVDSVSNPSGFMQILLWIKFGLYAVSDLFMVLPAISYILHVNILKATEGIYVIAAWSIDGLMYVLLYSKRAEISAILEKLQAMVDKSELTVN